MKLQHIIAAVFVAGISAAHAGLSIGDPMTDTSVEMKNVDGSMVTIDSIKGEKGTLVIFTCNHCPFVIGWQDTMVELANTYAKKGVGVIFINSNDAEKYASDGMEGMQKMAKEEGYEFPYVVDATSDVARHYGAKKTPDVFLFDADGNLAYQGAVGEGGQKPKKGGELWLKDALDAVIAGETVENSQTKAVGCGIKFR